MKRYRTKFNVKKQKLSEAKELGRVNTLNDLITLLKRNNIDFDKKLTIKGSVSGPAIVSADEDSVIID